MRLTELDRGPKRFAIISTCAESWGGSEELWWAAACELRARGHAVSVLKTVVDDGHPRIRHLRAIGCRVSDLASPMIARAGFAASVFMPDGYELNLGRCQMALAGAALTGRRPDLVLISQGRNLDGTHFAYVCKALRLDYVLVSQKATELEWPSDRLRTYHAKAFSGARSSVFVSDHNRRLTEEQLGLLLERALVFPNPILAGHDGALPWPRSEPGELRLACVARLHVADKGQDLLLRVLAKPRWRERRVRLSLYGDGPDGDGLARLATRLNCAAASFEGHSWDIERVWREHHALVLPSRAEGLPLALLEAMMCGRPAVVTDVGGNREVLRDGLTGILASGASVPALAEALERFWSLSTDWEAMGRAAAAHVRAVLPLDAGSMLTEHLLDLLRQRRHLPPVTPSVAERSSEPAHAVAASHVGRRVTDEVRPPDTGGHRHPALR